MKHSEIFNRQRILQYKQHISPNDAFVYQLMWDDVFERLQLILRKFEHVLVIAPPNIKILEKFANLTIAPISAIDWMWHTPCMYPNYTQKIEEAIDTVEHSYDLIISIAECAFINDLQRSLVKLNYALKPDGLMIVQCVGGNTLTELRQALMQAQSELGDTVGAHIHPMLDVKTFGSLLQHVSFALPVVDVETHTILYSNINRLLQDIKYHGASNCLVGRNVVLTRQVIARMYEIYAEKFCRPNGKFCATLDILCATAWAPHHSQQKPQKRGTAQISLHTILGKKLD